jgi:Ion channel
VFTTLTTLGYGDYYGTTTMEYIFTMFVEFLGVFVFAYMMGNINILVEKLDDDHLEYLQIENEKLDQWLIMVTRANDSRRFSEYFVDELRHRLNIYW